MNVVFEHDPQLRILKQTLFGVVDGKLLAEIMRVGRSLDRKLRPAEVIHDCTAVTSIDMKSVQVDSLANVTPVFSPEVREIIVAPQDYLFGLARMFQTMASEQRPHVFVARSLQEAHALMGISAAPAYALLQVADGPAPRL